MYYCYRVFYAHSPYFYLSAGFLREEKYILPSVLWLTGYPGWPDLQGSLVGRGQKSGSCWLRNGETGALTGL